MKEAFKTTPNPNTTKSPHNTIIWECTVSLFGISTKLSKELKVKGHTDGSMKYSSYDSWHFPA